MPCKKRKVNKQYFNYLCLFSSDEVLLFLLFIPYLFATSDVVNVNATHDPEINYTVYNDTSYETNENISILFSNMNDSIFNLSMSNLSADVATELESTISVTEDSDNFQSKTNKDLFLFLTPDEDICNCDLTSYVCDVNCCCDPDCSQEDVQVFSECTHQVLTPDENYCYRKDIILRNSTVYKMVRDPKNAMFCIVHDNLKHHLRFKDMPVLKSHRDVVTVLKYKFRNTYSWDLDTEKIYESSEWKVGKPIFVQPNQKNNDPRWSLPSSCLSDACTCNEEVRYLNSFRSSCSHFFKDLGHECGRNEILSGQKYADVCVGQSSASTSLANLVVHSKIVANNTSDDVEYDVSLDTKTICAKKTTAEKTTNGQGDLCKNVVRHVQFTVEHDGVNGIVAIRVDFDYVDVPLSVNLVAQSYTVDYVWTNATDLEKKSGNPGYQVGLPVLAATNGSDFNSEDMSKVFYEGGLSVLSRDSGSFCDGSRQVVKFGNNLKTGCKLTQKFENCEDLRSKVSDILLGPNMQQIYVGIFGNANLSNSNDWIEVFSYADALADDGRCLVSLGLNIHIIYAAVGTVANPQYKIVGVRYSRAKPEDVDLECKSPKCKSVTLSTAVSFFDVTLSAVEHYAKVPSIKANLPDDFFYPFLYGTSTKSVSHKFLILFLFLCCYYFKTASVIK